jgi:hypothetical protein
MAKHGSGPVEVIAVDAGIDRLFQGPLDDFTTARNALAARLKAAGRRDEAERVRALTKPALPAWSVNQVYWHATDVFDRLLRAGDRLRDTQLAGLKGSSSDVAQAALARQQAIDAVVERAMRFVTDAGSPASSATQQRVAVTADALAAYGTLPNRPAAGRLTGDLDPPGFGLLAALVPREPTGTGAQETGARGRMATGAKTGAPETRAQGQRGPGETKGGRAVGGNDERERHEGLERARFASARAESELRRRRSEQERATRDLERATDRLAAAQEAEQKAHAALITAQRAAAEARKAHAAAESRAGEAAAATAEAEREAANAKQRLTG